MINCRCNQNVDSGDLMIECTTCKKWVHAKCFSLCVDDLCVQKESCEFFCSPPCNQPTTIIQNCLWYQNQYPIQIYSTFGQSNDHLNRYVRLNDLEELIATGGDELRSSFSWTNHCFPASFLSANDWLVTKQGLEYFLKSWKIKSKRFRQFLYDSVLPLLK